MNTTIKRQIIYNKASIAFGIKNFDTHRTAFHHILGCGFKMSTAQIYYIILNLIHFLFPACIQFF